jgi:hypothetical protein
MANKTTPEDTTRRHNALRHSNAEPADPYRAACIGSAPAKSHREHADKSVVYQFEVVLNHAVMFNVKHLD